TISPFHHFTISLFHYFTISPFHHFTIFFRTFAAILTSVPGQIVFPPLRNSHQGPENPLAHNFIYHDYI
ncbi:MAG: hypothetical protein WCL03_14560, partial [Bacteroidota bacterium]